MKTKVIRRKQKCFSKKLFEKDLASIVNALQQWEKTPFSNKDKKIHSYLHLRNSFVEKLTYRYNGHDENILLHRFFSLFELKHALSTGYEVLFSQLARRHEGKSIGFLGSLASGKSTIAMRLIKDIGADLVTVEPYQENPFWEKSQTDSDYMLRSQIFFFLSNIISDIKTRLACGISVSDTSIFTDILMWANWYHAIGRLTDSEYRLYERLVDMFKEIIPKPDLLVALIPTSVQDVKLGIVSRGRISEQQFASPESTDIAVQVERVLDLIDIIPSQWGIPVLKIVVDPQQAYKDPKLTYDYIHRIRACLGLLGKLLEPMPEDVANKIIRILSRPNIPGQMIIIHSKSMFSGKTTALCLVAEKVGKEHIVAFEPYAALRPNEPGFEKQNKAVISRDGLQIPATVIKDNSLLTLLKKVKSKRLNPQTTPYIFIDEIMLFISHADDHNKALEALEELREMGFHVITDGIDYTFQEEPFTFMHDLLQKAKHDKNWHEFEMSTRCRYCDRRAQGTRLTLNGGQIADYAHDFQVAGSRSYEPVCCVAHVSCTGQFADFVKRKLP